MSLWTEDWRCAEDRIAEIERAARADGAPVFCGGTWDRWDLHLRAGLLGGSRLRMGLEEHGGGRQLVRTRITPHVPVAVLAIGAVLATVTAAAALAQAWAAAALLGIVLTGVGGAVLWETGVATAWLTRYAPPQR